MEYSSIGKSKQGYLPCREIIITGCRKKINAHCKDFPMIAICNNFIGKYDLPSRLNFSREFYDINMVRKQEITQISVFM